jgi:VanZ family protein
MFFVMGSIFFLSHQPNDTLPIPVIYGLDKCLHFIAYGTLAASVVFAVSGWRLGVYRRKTWLLIFLFCTVYGMLDEFHQSFVPGRMVSFYDVLADATGAVVVLLVTRMMLCRRKAVVEQ